MDRGRGHGRAGKDPSPLRRRLAQRFALIETNRESLRESFRRHYPDEESFLEDWMSSDFEAKERIAALERFYERIINPLNQIFDNTEKALEANGKLPALPKPKRGHQPGRWERLAGYGVLPAELVDPMRRLIGQRNIFQKEYETLGPTGGADVFEDAKELIRLLPKVIPPIQSWVDKSIV